MTALSNRQIVEAIYEEALRGEFGALYRYMAPDCDIREAEGLPHAGHYIGPHGFLAVFAKFAEYWDPFGVAAEAVIADGDYVVVLATLSGTSRRNGKSFSMPLAEVWKLAESLVIQVRPFYWDTHALHLPRDEAQGATP